MGGKKQQAQRTKNNAKPSSSGRTAELLSSNPAQFSGFTSLKGAHFPTSAPTPITFDVFDSQLDPNLVVILKKLSKKDATTRFKALNELTALVKDCDDSAVNTLLPYWAKLYVNLVVDVDHKVREATQLSHRAIAVRVGRNLAPHIKQIVPSWFMSQCDTHPPAASAAALAFKEAFPPRKIVDVIVFCQAEIVKYISDNILVERNIPKNDEESEAKSERITVACLNGYALYLSRIPSQNLEAALEDNINIISSPQFWKLQKHKSRNVRAAFFSLLTSIMKNSPSLIENEHKRLANSILSTIDDYDPVVLPTVWESVLHLITTVPGCWQHVNLDKLVLNKVCSIVGHGGQGSAHLVFPNILLLLSKIPGDVIKNHVQFYSKIFSSFLQGMKQPSVTQSQSESDAVATSFHECVRYILMSNLENTELCTIIIKDHVLVSYSNLVQDPVHRHLVSPYYSAFVQNLLYWQKNSETNTAYATHLNFICESLPSVNIRNLNKFCEDRHKIAFIHECQVKFIRALNHPSTKKKKHLKVQFSFGDSSKPPPGDSGDTTEEVEPADINAVTLQTKMYPLIDELIKKHFTVACSHESNEVKAMNVDQLYRLTSVLNKDQLDRLSQTYAKDLYPALTNWLRCDYIPVNCILGLIFNTVENVEEEQRSSILSQLTEIRPDESVLEVIKMASQELSGQKTFKKWLESDKIRSEVVKTLNDRIESGESCVHLLEMCWSTYRSGEPVLGTNTVSELLEVVSRNLESGRITHSVISQLFDSLLVGRNHYIVSVCGQKVLFLLKSLFVIVLTNNEPDVVASWKNGLKFVFSLPWDDSGLLLEHAKDCINIVPELMNAWDAFSISNVKRAAELMYFMAMAYADLRQTAADVEGVSCMFLANVLNVEWDTQFSLVDELVFSAEVIHGHFLSSKYSSGGMSVTKGSWDPLRDLDLVKFARSATFCAKYMMMALGSLVPDEFESSEYDPLRESISRKIPKIDWLTKLVHGLVLCQKFLLNFQSAKQCVGLDDCISSLTADCRELVQKLTPAEQSQMIDECLTRCQSNDGHSTWKYTARLIRIDFLDLAVPEVQGNENLPENISSQTLHLLRSSCTDTDHLRKVFTVLVNTYKTSEYSAFTKSLSQLTPEHMTLNAEIGRFLRFMIDHHADVVGEVDKGWDMVMISVASWFMSLSTTGSVTCYKEFVQFVVSASNLLVVFVGHFVKNEEASKSTLYDEWTKLFATETYSVLRQCWSTLAGLTLDSNLTPEGLVHVDALSRAICQLCDWIIPGMSFITVDNFDEFMAESMKTIISPHIPVQVTTYVILTNAVEQLIKKDENFDENTLHKLSCECCLQTFTTAQNVVTALLRDFSLGISCAVRPHTDGYTYTLAYVMLWCWLLEMCRKCDSQQRYVYTLWIKERNLIPHVIESVFKLMPESILKIGETGLKKKQEIFVSRPPLSSGTWSSEKLSHLSCWLYCELLRTLPAVARQWTAEAEPKFLSFVDKLTSTYVSPILCNEEMEAIKNQQKAFDNVEVQTHSAVREVIAVYTVEETSTELIIKLAHNHPLSPPKVEISKAIKISSNQNRQLLMQLTIFLTHQNGSIWDGLLLWKSNLDKKFEGVEECYICFSIVHQSSHQLPKMTCGTCKKKFHSFCLYKWFTTSNMSTCPICRNHF